MVLNDIIEQAAGRQSRGSDHGGKLSISYIINKYPFSKPYLTSYIQGAPYTIANCLLILLFVVFYSSNFIEQF